MPEPLGPNSQGVDSTASAGGAHCPFCGADAVDPDTDYGDTCAHLVAQWAMDPDDDGGGVAAQSTYYLDALGPGRELGLACRDLLLFIVEGQDEAGIERQLARVRAAIAFGGPPSWWQDVEDWTLSRASEDDMPSEADEGLGSMAGPIVLSLASEVPGIQQTSALLGGMTSGDWNFLWSLDRVAAARAVHDAIFAAAATVRSLIAPAAKPGISTEARAH